VRRSPNNRTAVALLGALLFSLLAAHPARAAADASSPAADKPARKNAPPKPPEFVPKVALRAAAADASSARPKPATQILISGSGWTGFLVRRWARAYQATHPGVRVRVKGGGTGSGLAALVGGRAEIAYAERPLKGSEIASARDQGLLLTGHSVAIDGVAVVINPANPAAEATKPVLAGVFAGDLDEWADLGGPSHKISLYCQRPASRASELFKLTVMGDVKPAERCKVVSGPRGLSQALEADPYGIGYARLSEAQDDETLKVLKLGRGKGVPSLNPMRADGKWINPAVVSGGDYPLARTLYLYTQTNPSEPVQQFLDWVLSPEGQALVEKEGYVALPGQLPPPPPNAFAD
jgi:phosphate transport system substrate-binding protein